NRLGLRRMNQVHDRRRQTRQRRPKQTPRQQKHEPSVQGVDQKIRQPETRRPHMPDWVLEGEREERKRTIDAGVVEVAPVRLKQQMDWIDMPDAFVSAYDEDIVEDESVGNRVGVANRDQRQTDDEGADRGLVVIEQVHPLVQLELASDLSSIE